MTTVLCIVGLDGTQIDGNPNVPTGQYVKDFDADAHDGRGFLTTTEAIERARTFPSVAAALMYWKTQSTVRPRREDGKPNRPMTAYSIEILESRT